MRFMALLLCLLAMMTLPLRATDNPPPIDIMLALDNSGSMKKNDPKKLLLEVVTSFASRLGNADRLGIVAFDQTARTLLPLTDVKASNFSSALARAMHRVNYSGGLTDIPGGLEEARKEIEKHRRPNAQRVIVLLTDGEIDLRSDARNSDRKIWLRERILPAVSRLGVRIFGITLTADADVELIQSMAEATQGNYFRLLKAEEIPEVFNGIIVRLQEIRDIQLAEQAAVKRKRAEHERLERDRLERDQREFKRTSWLIVGTVSAIVISIFAIMLLLRRRSDTPSVSVPAARLIDLGRQTGEIELPIKGPLTRIGRLDDQNDIVVKSDYVGREHGLIEFKNGAFHLRDLRSTNGTFLNDIRIAAGEELGPMLKHGDIIRLGPYSFRFVIDRMLEAEQAQQDGKPIAAETVRLGEAAETRRIPKGSGAAPGVTFEKPAARRPSAKPEAAPPPSSSSAVAPGDYCEFHQSRSAIARCVRCGHLICDLEEPVDVTEGGKSCRAVVEGRTCPNRPGKSEVRQSA